EAPRLGRGDGPEAGGQAVQRPSQARRRFPSQAMTTSPRAVIFDFGGVIWNMEWEAARALEAEHGLPQGSLRATLYDGDAWARRRSGSSSLSPRSTRSRVTGTGCPRTPACSSTTTSPTSPRPRAPGFERSCTASTGATTCARSSRRPTWASRRREVDGPDQAGPGPPRRGHRDRLHRLPAHREVDALRLAVHDRHRHLLGGLRGGPSAVAAAPRVPDRAHRHRPREPRVRDRRAYRVLGRG